MSAGRFTRTRYELDQANGGIVLACKVQPETLAATIGTTANAAPADPVDFNFSATISQGRRSAGVNMRSVTLAWTTDPPEGYAAGGTIRIPVLTPATFAAWTLGATGTYLGTGVTVVGRSPETLV